MDALKDRVTLRKFKNVSETALIIGPWSAFQTPKKMQIVQRLRRKLIKEPGRAE